MEVWGISLNNLQANLPACERRLKNATKAKANNSLGTLQGD
jgi:hypothetical protein